MSDSEITRWEEQARVGLFHRDEDLRQLQNQLRRAVTDPVTLADGTRITLAEIGITTGYGTGALRNIGMLQIDEERLREALAENPERVQGLFMHEARYPAGHPNAGMLMSGRTPAERSARMSVSGLGDRLHDALANSIDRDGVLYRRAGSENSNLSNTQNQMSRQMRTYDERLEQMQRWLARREAHFFQMFARMEQAMAQANAQMDSLWMFATQ
jgi:flagellar hook-associated protein 2